MRSDGSAPGRRTSSSGRMLELLDLFTPGQSVLTAADIAGRLGCSPATAYRYAAELCGAGLLARFSGAFALGPRIIELDRMIRDHDPLLLAGRPVLQRLRDRTGCDVMVVEMFSDAVVTVHHERGTDPATVTFTRGRRMPLLRGAGSKAIVSNLPLPALRQLFERNAAMVAEAGLGEDWPGFRASMAALRKAGHAVSLGELDPQNVGIGVPLLHGAGVPPGSLVAVMSSVRWEITDRRRVIGMVASAGAEISGLLREAGDGETMRVHPARPGVDA